MAAAISAISTPAVGSVESRANDIAAAPPMYAVSADSHTDAWAVGGLAVLHWDGTTWHDVEAPDAVVDKVVALSPTDVWAVGDDNVEHWDGAGWTQYQPLPGVNLDSVDADGPDDVWVVGFQYTGGDTTPVSAHWDGASWRQVPVPNRTSPSGRFGAGLLSVSVLSPTNAWAVGGFGKDLGHHTYVVHWNGSDWRPVRAFDPNGRSGDTFASLDVLSRHNIWAVGKMTDATDHDAPLIEHYDGTQWSLVDAPTGKGIPKLTQISMASADVGFAVGERKFADQWDGTIWTVASPQVFGPLTRFYGVSARSGKDVWIVGWDGSFNALIEHWNGQAWKVYHP